MVKENLQKIKSTAKGSRVIFKHIGGDYTLPTTTMIDPRTNEPTSNNKRIFELFLETRKGIFNRHKENPPKWKTFEHHYNQHIPISELADQAAFTNALRQVNDKTDNTTMSDITTTNTAPNHQEMYEQSQRGKDASDASMDGIKLVED